MKLIPLTQGKFAKVDDDDYERLSRHKWHYSNGYARRNSSSLFGKRKIISMHNEIIPHPQNTEIDHKNTDGCDNRKENLRICTKAQNQHNKNIQRNNTTGYKGVYIDKRVAKKKYYSHIKVGGVKKVLGSFYSAEDCARAYDVAAIRYFGEFANINFPDEVS